MNQIMDFLPSALLRSTLGLAAAAVLVRLALWLAAPHSPRIHRAAWTCVLVQGLIVAQFSFNIPWYDREPSLAVNESVDSESVDSESDVVGPVGAHTTGPAATNWLASARQRIWELPDFMAFAASPLRGQQTAARDAQEAVTAKAGSQRWDSGQLSRGLVAVWLAGMGVLAGLTLGSYGLLLLGLRRTHPARARWQREWRSLLKERGIRSRIPLVTHGRLGPMLCRTPRGFCVVVPRGLWSRFTAPQRLAILRHELSHYQRGDVWKSLVARMLALPHWFNPFSWWAVRKFEETGEWACDQCLAEHDPRGVPDFARALLAIVEPNSRQVCASCARGAPLAIRLRRLLAFQIPEDSLMKRALVLSTLLGLLAVGTLRLHLVAKEALDAGVPSGAQAESAAAADESSESQAVAAAPEAEAAAPAAVSQSLESRIEELADRMQPGDSAIVARLQQVLRTRAGQVVLQGRAANYENTLRDEARNDALPGYLARHFVKNGGRYVLQPGAEEYRRQLLDATEAFNEDVRKMAPVLQEVADNFIGDAELDRLIIRFLKHEAAPAMLYVQGLHRQLRPDETVVQEQLGTYFVANEQGQFAIRGSGRIEAEQYLRSVRRMERGLKSLRSELQTMAHEFANRDELHQQLKQALQEPLFAAFAAQQVLSGDEDVVISERLEQYFAELDQLAQDMGDGLQIVSDEQRQAVTSLLTDYHRIRTLSEKLRGPLQAFAARVLPGETFRDSWREALTTDALAVRMATDLGGVPEDPAEAARALLGDSLQRGEDGKYRVRAEEPEAVGEFVREMLRMYRNVRRKGLDVDELAEHLDDAELRTALASIGGKFVLTQAVEKQLVTQYFDGLGRWVEDHFEHLDDGLVMRDGAENELTAIAEEAAAVEKELGKDDF